MRKQTTVTGPWAVIFIVLVLLGLADVIERLAALVF